MKKALLFTIFTGGLALFVSCSHQKADNNRKPLLEVEGRFLYEDQIQQIIPPNVSKQDSTEIANSFIQKWVTDVLMYENAKRNITNKSEIDELVENYRKSLIIHQYQQKMIAERLPKEPTEEELKTFYSQYSDQLILKENVIKGLLLVVPAKAPKLSNVKSWVQSGNAKALESIEKYSIQSAISYDYFGDRWLALSDVLKKIPVQISDPANFVSTHRYYEAADSTNCYLLRIESYRTVGQVEPFDMARDRIANIIMNRKKADFMDQFETDIYEDAVKDESITFFNKKKK